MDGSVAMVPIGLVRVEAVAEAVADAVADAVGRLSDASSVDRLFGRSEMDLNRWKARVAL